MIQRCPSATRRRTHTHQSISAPTDHRAALQVLFSGPGNVPGHARVRPSSRQLPHQLIRSCTGAQVRCRAFEGLSCLPVVGRPIQARCGWPERRVIVRAHWRAREQPTEAQHQQRADSCLLNKLCATAWLSTCSSSCAASSSSAAWCRARSKLHELTASTRARTARRHFISL